MSAYVRSSVSAALYAGMTTTMPLPATPAGPFLLRGDRATLLTLVGILAGDAASEQRHWQLLLTDLVDGIMARAIEAGRLDYS